MFTLFVSSASVAVEEKEIITAGRVGLQCSIRFSPDWDGLVKTAVFDGAESRDVIVTGERVTIPAECLAAAGDCLKAGFYGKSTDGAVVIPTVWASLGMIEHSVYPSGREGAAPTPDVVAQIQQAAANAEKMARSVREDADLGRLAGPAGSKGEKGDKGDKGDKGADGKSAYRYAVEGGYTGTEAEFAAKLAAEMPTTLPNPNALTFTGAVTGSYDGSEPLNVKIPSGGGGSGGGEAEFPNWRLIKTISFSADIASVDFDTDDNGNTFSLKEIMLAGSVPAYSGYIYMRPNPGGYNNAIWPTAGKDLRWWAASVNGILKTMLAVSNASVIWPIDKDPVCENDTISRLVIGASAGFTADGTMYVYGR